MTLHSRFQQSLKALFPEEVRTKFHVYRPVLMLEPIADLGQHPPAVSARGPHDPRVLASSGSGSHERAPAIAERSRGVLRVKGLTARSGRRNSMASRAAARIGSAGQYLVHDAADRCRTPSATGTAAEAGVNLARRPRRGVNLARRPRRGFAVCEGAAYVVVAQHVARAHDHARTVPFELISIATIELPPEPIATKKSLYAAFLGWLTDLCPCGASCAPKRRWHNPTVTATMCSQ
jgi:hypothetical protein